MILSVVFIPVSELEIKTQKQNFEKQSDAIKSDAEHKLAEIQALLEAERVRHKIEVLNLVVLTIFAQFGARETETESKTLRVTNERKCYTF